MSVTRLHRIQVVAYPSSGLRILRDLQVKERLRAIPSSKSLNAKELFGGETVSSTTRREAFKYELAIMKSNNFPKRQIVNIKLKLNKRKEKKKSITCETVQTLA